ncbi:MAG: hypothetical protein ABSG13_18395 [Bryobacteraceae bacterium]
MTRMWTAALLLASSSAWAQPSIALPQLGFVEDSARALRPAYGLAGNFILGPPIAGKIITEAFCGSFGLLKTDSSLSAFDAAGKLLATMDVAPGPALFAFSPDTIAALAYIASSNTLLEWRGHGFAPLSLNYIVTSETVLAIAFPTAAEALLIVQRNGSIWELNLPLGAIGAVSQNALSGVRAPLLALPLGDLVYRDTEGIAIRRTDRSEVHLAAPLPGSFSLQQMNQEWVQLTDLTSNARFAIRTTPGREGFYQLPEITPALPRSGLLRQ